MISSSHFFPFVPLFSKSSTSFCLFHFLPISAAVWPSSWQEGAALAWPCEMVPHGPLVIWLQFHQFSAEPDGDASLELVQHCSPLAGSHSHGCLAAKKGGSKCTGLTRSSSTPLVWEQIPLAHRVTSQKRVQISKGPVLGSTGLLALASCTLSKAQENRLKWAPFEGSTFWGSYPRAVGKHLCFDTGTCGTNNFEPLVGAVVGCVPGSALPHSYQAPSPSPCSSGLSPVGPDSNCPLFLLLYKYPFSSHPSSRCEAKWARKEVVGRVVGETHITQGSICPICIGSAGPKACFLEVFVKEGF